MVGAQKKKKKKNRKEGGGLCQAERDENVVEMWSISGWT